MKSTGEKITIIRKEKGMTMDEFAKMIDDKAKSGTVANWETGKNLPNNARLKKIAEIGGVSVNYLLAEGFQLSSFLKKERGDKTQELFSKELDISRSYLNDLENDRRSPSVETLEKIARKLNKKLIIRFDSL